MSPNRDEVERVGMALEVLADTADGQYIAGVTVCPECGEPHGWFAPMNEHSEFHRGTDF